ncbi:acyltransferase family protein [Serratia sp. L9]|uniref:acyltransferase family protein n=1 Tax=Serratia sp. L9 TaxID=3423946 RepID=UPI003D674CB5
MKPNEIRNNFHGITALRAIAASVVLIVHSSALLSFNHEISKLVILTNIGVDIFFIISGFIITYAHWNDFGRGAQGVKGFIRKRFVRIYPMYLLFTLITALALFMMPQLFFSLKSSFELLFSSLLFLPSKMANGDVTLLLAVAWTLSYEVAFYAIFSIAMLFNRRMALVVTSVALIAWSSLSLIQQDNYISNYFFTTLPIEFLVGMIICIIFKTSSSIPSIAPLTSGVLVVIAIITLYYLFFIAGFDTSELRSNTRFIYFGIPALIIFISFFNTPYSKKSTIRKVVEVIGSASYVTYLSHFLIIGVIKFIMKVIPGTQQLPLAITVIASCIICTVAGVFIHIYIEKPAISFFRKKKTREAIEN